MKTTILLVHALLLSGCAVLSPAPTVAATAPASSTPYVIIHTVLVSVIPTWPPTTILPTRTSVPTSTARVIVVTATPGPAELTQTATARAAVSGATATLPADAGGGLFTSLSRSSDHFALRCEPDVITFGVSTSNAHVVAVDLYYRIQDRLSASISNWQYGGTMLSDKHGNFSLDFPASRVDPDLRSHRAWFDYQFVATNSLGDVLGRSAKIAQQITYTIDCSD